MTQVPEDSSLHIHHRHNLRRLFIISCRVSLPIWSRLSWSDGFLYVQYSTVWRLQKHFPVSLWSFFPYFLVFVFCIFFLCRSSALSFFCFLKIIYCFLNLPLMNLSLSLIFCSLLLLYFFLLIFPSTHSFRKVKHSHYRPGVAQRVPGS